jgi:Ca2+-binding RTX toxin-like protein
MHHDSTFKGILAAMFFLGAFYALDAGAHEEDATFPGDFPEGRCDNAQTVTACNIHEDGSAMDCGPETLCSDDSVGEDSGASTFAGEGGGLTPLATCYSISGTGGDDTIRIGAIYFWNSDKSRWDTYGDFGYCKNGVLTSCSSVTSPLPVKPYQGNDVVGTTSSIVPCVADSTAIGPWSNLDAEWQGTRLNVYACAGTDYMYGTPNVDLLIGGSGTDYAYGKGGDDNICGGYGTFSGHTCSFCNSGTNCTSSGGSDTGTDLDDLCSGEDGNDNICGVDGADNLQGGAGSDHIWGLNGCDYMYGGSGVDYIYAARGTSGTDLNDTYCTSGGHNSLVGGDGDDYLYGSNAVDFLWGEVWNDYTAPEYDGADYLNGYGGDDKLCGGGALNGYDDAYGGSGNDLIVYYASNYNEGNCSSCIDGRSADGESGDDDNLIYRGIHCELEDGGGPPPEEVLHPCLGAPPDWCMGGITLEGGDGSDDCCDCWAYSDYFIANTCEYYGCEDMAESGGDAICGDEPDWGFDCPYPYLYTNLGPGWTCY